jgi:hypothetical protein
MWNLVSHVARHNNIPEADLVDYAISRDAKYRVIIEHGEAMISNFHVERLIADFEREQAEVKAADDAAEAEHLLDQHPHLNLSLA